MSKAAQIRKLHAAGQTPQEIAEIVGCSDSYVRVVARQRANGYGAADLKYQASAKGQKSRAKNITGNCAYIRAVRETGDKEKMKQAARRAYRAARNAGKTTADAKYAASRARNRVVFETGDKCAAKAARQLAKVSE